MEFHALKCNPLIFVCKPHKTTKKEKEVQPTHTPYELYL
jgi:hypothetical protein